MEMDAQEVEKFGAQTQEALETVFSFVPALVLKSALLLEIPDIIARQGPNASLSVQEIAARLPTKNPHLDNLSRILRYLSTKGVFIQSRVGDGDEVRYALTDTAKLFYVKGENPSSIVHAAMLETQEALMARWHHVHECVLQGGHALRKAHGKDVYACARDDPHLNSVINDYMAADTMTSIEQILKHYDGFQELKSVVDLGGSKGTALGEIVKAHPHIHGINFDLPHVIATAQPIPGIEHVGGSMFDGIPSADAIFIKNILVDWDDESCMKILKNCHKALPENGKLVVIEEMMPETVELIEMVEIMKVAPLTELLLRNEQEWIKILQNSGFCNRKVLSLPGAFSNKIMIEAIK
ncbi:hypothetical protein KI387_014274 [Taxus chinensis]|uniref:Uncharacterized protein n=1 Tax=Taxus chinensis TaxID=29808 RepID=A0AA38CJR0_TAXCH|nr:hypothetical protein KI387_014274 [Taxus chinensis]